MLGRVADPAPHRAAPAGATRTAAFFDLDKTIIAKSSTLAFSRSFYQGGLINRRAVLRSAYAQFVYLVGRRRPRPDGADAGTTSPRWPPAGTSQQVKDIVAETLHELIDPMIYDEAATLIEEHHLAGRDVVIVSTSGAEVVEPIGEMLGADQVIATRMVVRGRPLLRRDRVLRLRRDQGRGDPRAGRATRATTSTRCYAYSDSATDVPMLEAVGHPYAVNPDRALRKEAATRGWPVLVFSRPVRLRDRFAGVSLPQPTTLAAVAVGAGAATAGVVWLARRRRRGASRALLPRVGRATRRTSRAGR